MGSSVNFRWISQKHLTQSGGRRKLSFNRKRYGSNARGEGSPQGSPECLVRDPNRQRRGGRTSAPRLTSRGRPEGPGVRQGRKVPGRQAGGRAAQGMTPGSTEAQADRLPGVPPRPGVLPLGAGGPPGASSAVLGDTVVATMGKP